MAGHLLVYKTQKPAFDSILAHMIVGVIWSILYRVPSPRTPTYIPNMYIIQAQLYPIFMEFCKFRQKSHGPKWAWQIIGFATSFTFKTFFPCSGNLVKWVSPLKLWLLKVMSPTPRWTEILHKIPVLIIRRLASRQGRTGRPVTKQNEHPVTKLSVSHPYQLILTVQSS